jgi:hypothetical protein
VCPYCGGKGYVSDEVYLDHNDVSGDTKTWVRKNCPLCGGTGHLRGDGESSAT